MVKKIITKIVDTLLEMAIKLLTLTTRIKFGFILYFIEMLLAQLIGFLFDVFEMFAGIKTVKYYGNDMFLMEVFTSKNTIGGNMMTGLYWRIAVIGCALSFGFAIFAVVRKMFDDRERIGQSMGVILSNLFKGIFIILLMGGMMSVIMRATSVVMQQIMAAFHDVGSKGSTVVVTYTEEDYADMAHIMDTIGNYSLNPSYNSRYNLNCCYNAIRPRLQKLEKNGVFMYPYESYNDKQEKICTWQSELQALIGSKDLSEDIPVDVYDSEMSEELLVIMELLRKDSSFAPLSSYTYNIGGSELAAGNYEIEDLIMVIGSLGAAWKDTFNDNYGAINDKLRAPYLFGKKSFFKPWNAFIDFDTSLGVWNHVTVLFLCIGMLRSMINVMVTVGSRVLNIAILYVTMPIFASVTPLDDGEKLKQWMQAFIVQCFGFMGPVIAMQMYIFLLPAILDSNLRFFDGMIANWFAKAVLMVTMLVGVDSAGGLISGILAGNGGGASSEAVGVGRRAQAWVDQKVEEGIKMAASAGAGQAAGAGAAAADSAAAGSGSNAAAQKGASQETLPKKQNQLRSGDAAGGSHTVDAPRSNRPNLDKPDEEAIPKQASKDAPDIRPKELGKNMGLEPLTDADYAAVQQQYWAAKSSADVPGDHKKVDSSPELSDAKDDFDIQNSHPGLSLEDDAPAAGNKAEAAQQSARKRSSSFSYPQGASAQAGSNKNVAPQGEQKADKIPQPIGSHVAMDKSSNDAREGKNGGPFPVNNHAAQQPGGPAAGFYSAKDDFTIQNRHSGLSLEGDVPKAGAAQPTERKRSGSFSYPQGASAQTGSSNNVAPQEEQKADKIPQPVGSHVAMDKSSNDAQEGKNGGPFPVNNHAVQQPGGPAQSGYGTEALPKATNLANNHHAPGAGMKIPPIPHGKPVSLDELEPSVLKKTTDEIAKKFFHDPADDVKDK